MFHRRQLITALSTLVLLAGCSGEPEQPAASTAAPAVPAAADPVLPDAVAAHGLAGMNSITFSGSAWRIRNSFRQTLTASPPWPEHDEITNYVRTVDLGSVASRATGDTFASDLFLNPPVAGVYQQNVTPETSAWGQQLEYWLTPWGFLKGAQANNATESVATVNGQQLTAISWQPAAPVAPGGIPYTVTGYVGADNLVQRVETRVEDSFMGDMLVANLYSGYMSMGGVQVPMTIEQQRGGGGIFGVNVAAATVNPGNATELLAVPPPAAPGGPPPGGGAPPAAPAELSQELAPGVYLITGGYQALAMDFNDFVAVFEAGQPEARGDVILAETKRLFPGKEIRYIINSHPHSDHTGGLIPFVREGATIVTHQNNVDFMNMALSTPRTLLGEETLAPKFEGVTGVYVIENGDRRLELHHIPNLHSDGMLVALVPGVVMFEADFTLPVNGAAANPFVIDLANYVDANGLEFDQYIAVHAAAVPQTKADLMATIGK